MIGIMNNSARQFNIHAMDQKTARRVTVRLVPGLNKVDGELWKIARSCDFVKQRMDKKEISEDEKLTDKAIASQNKVEIKPSEVAALEKEKDEDEL